MLLLSGCTGGSPGPFETGLPVLGSGAQAARYTAVQQALEESDSGHGVAWADASGTARGIVTPIATMPSRIYGWCRDYEERILAGRQMHALVGIACREPDRRWLVLDIRPVAAAG